MTSSETIGAVGVTLLLLAYLLNVLKVIKPESVAYSLMNFVGAAMACYSSWLIRFIPFVILEGVWAIVSLIPIIRLLVKGNTRNEQGS